MWRELMTNISIDDFNSAIANKKVIILYPQSSYRNVFLSYLFLNTGATVSYYRIKAHENTIVEMLAGLVDEVSDDFGETIRKNLASDNMASLASALAKDLNNYNANAILYLDEVDNLPLDDNYRLFFTELEKNLSQGNRVVINSRQLTTEPWQGMVLSNDAVVVGTERRQSKLMFTADEADKPQLEIYGFGRGHAIVNGLPVDSWDGALPRNLFFYFIDKDLVTRDEIFNVFWSDLNVKEATNVFHVTKRKISERLSVNVLGGGNYELTKYSTGFYRPADKIARHYDVAEFEAAVDEASMTFDDDEQAVLYRRAVDLYRAPFLLTIDMPWVYDRREKLQRQLLEALIGLARIYKSQEKYEESLGYFMRAIHETPLREDIHREVMGLYQKLGYADEAVRQYQQLEILLQDMLGVAPGPETQELLQQIQN